jgi:hypothetical protein
MPGGSGRMERAGYRSGVLSLAQHPRFIHNGTSD